MVGSPVPLGGVQLLLLLLHLLHLLPLALLPASPNLQCQSVLERGKIRVGAYICQSGKTFQVLARCGLTWNVSRLELTGSRQFCQLGIHCITVSWTSSCREGFHYPLLTLYRLSSHHASEELWWFYTCGSITLILNRVFRNHHHWRKREKRNHVVCNK